MIPRFGADTYDLRDGKVNCPFQRLGQGVESFGARPFGPEKSGSISVDHGLTGVYPEFVEGPAQVEARYLGVQVPFT